MISIVLGGFLLLLLGIVFSGVIGEEINTATAVNGSLYNSSTWGNNSLKLVSGFFTLVVLGIAIAVVYASLRAAGIV